MSLMTEVTMWSKQNPSWGQRRRVQRNYYAFLVAMVLTGGAMECPACNNPLDLDTAEVDKAVPSLDYRPGNIVYLCRGCNGGRGVLQSTGHDWRHADDYAQDIHTASAHIDIPSEADAMRWWSRRPTVTTHPRYA